jgi:hypothetical protein
MKRYLLLRLNKVTHSYMIMKWCNKDDENNLIPIIDYYYIDDNYIDKFSMSSKDVKDFKKRVINYSDDIKNIDLSSCQIKIMRTDKF